jgi:diguanylate cyclase (GGDEF)-like protein
MKNAPKTEEEQRFIGAGDFVVYADFNCPFCYALNERLQALGLEDRVDYRSVQHAPAASSENTGISILTALSREVADVRRRAPSVQIATPLFRPSSAAATELLDRVSSQSPRHASRLRRAIFQALWVEGLDISLREVLDSLLVQQDIDLGLVKTGSSETLSAWQTQWSNDSEFEGNIPVVISEQGEKVIGFPLESELNAFLQTGSLVSDQLLHDSVEPKVLQRILVLDNDVAALQMLIEQMSTAQVEIAEDFAALVAAARNNGMPDLVVVNTALLGDNEGTDWWRNSTDSNLDAPIPVIFLSDDKSTEAEVDAFESGAADFIAKPFHPRVLRARLNMHLQARESQRQLNNIARVDALTSICNRREFDLRLMAEWSRGARTGQSLALLMIDVDKFKQYNDHYGHLRGDACLIAVARILDACTQRTSDLVARYGGEEFVVLLPESDIEGAVTVAEDCLEALENASLEHVNSNVEPYVTVSIGVAAMLPIHDKSSTILIEQADVALYQAKQNGRNRFCSFNEWS